MNKDTNWEFIKFFIIVVLIIVPFRLWIAQPFIVSGASMEPTFENGDYLIVDELSFHLRDPKKGEVIIFRYPLNPSKFFIKRVMGLPNETIYINNNKIILNEEEYFVLGDNRQASSDSRIWGSVNKNLIVGRAFLRLWPFNKLGIMPGYEKQEN
jgi:signal peptidase I